MKPDKKEKPKPKRKPAKTPVNKALDPAPENKALDTGNASGDDDGEQ